MRGNGERIGPQNLPTSSIAGGIWNLLNQQRAQQRGAWPSATPAVVTDPYFMYVPLLLNTTSTNGQQNNTFLDSSTNNFTITRNGTPTQGSFTPYQPSGYWSGYFNGSTDYITAPANSAFVMGTGAFTIECWFYTSSATAATSKRIIGTYSYTLSPPSTDKGWFLGCNRTSSANKLEFYMINSSGGINSLLYTGTLTYDTWHHVAISRNGSNVASMYLDGTRIVTSSSFTVNDSNTGLPLNIGSENGAAGTFYDGYVSNARVVKGTAVYDPTLTTLTVPTTPLTAITNTSLLTLQSNRFIDNSTNAFAITVNGTPKVQAFQPFSPAASYSAATYGGSGYFNGTSDYLSLTSNAALAFGTGDFTIESWIYLTSLSGSNTICDNRTADTASAYVFYVQSNGTLTFYDGAGGADRTSSAGAIKANTWYHVVATRSGTTFNLYINGAVAATNTGVSSNFGSSQPLRIGQQVAGTASWNGYISNLRLVKGTAIYTAAFTPPTIPVTAVSGTSLLTNFTNAGIYDAAWQNNALTVGDAQASTTQYKWSPTSMKFDGTGDYLTMPLSAGTTITSGNFTVEFWLYPSTVATATQAIIGTTEGDTAGTINWMAYLVSSSLYFQCYSNSSTLMVQFNHQTSLSAGNWYYCAVTRSGSTFTLYLNGVASTSTPTSSATINQSGSTLYVGKFGASSSIGALNGYIQDLRITKGVARTITTPTAAFPTR